ncbi:sigma-54 interaction domain-containing protein [Brevibacillus ginsengisoli]|uniref:sigma-54 interaction domain-containing protein n=1 Tax=Brevibacillus ginsengisoli TaxID=363854 RepID=UPI003CF9DC04
MENIRSVEKEVNQWGYIKVDVDGKLIDSSPEFCHHFAKQKADLLGAPITNIIQGISWKHFLFNDFRKQVFYGNIFGYACLIRVTRSLNHFLFDVVVRQEEVDYDQIISFGNALNKPSLKKRSGNNNLYSFEDIIGESPSMAQIKELAARIAASNSTVLITGESGTGKELFAQAIHGLSARRNHPFIAINCAAIPDELFESEVFGYEAGAFSGAKKEGKPGKIEMAQNGTIFLDEISELPYQVQGKLLRVLQEREIERLGGTGSKNVDIRIVAATNRDLKALVQEGKFRQDLFYRLYVFELKIPSLWQRKEDILPLAYYFINVFNVKLGQNVKQIEPKLQEWLMENEWTGNVRELKAHIERGMNIVQGPTLALECLCLPPLINLKNENSVSTEHTILMSLEDEVEKAEKSAILRSLKEFDGDRILASQKLKIHVSSLYRKMAKYKIK